MEKSNDKDNDSDCSEEGTGREVNRYVRSPKNFGNSCLSHYWFSSFWCLHNADEISELNEQTYPSLKHRRDLTIQFKVVPKMTVDPYTCRNRPLYSISMSVFL